MQTRPISTILPVRAGRATTILLLVAGGLGAAACGGDEPEAAPVAGETSTGETSTGETSADEAAADTGSIDYGLVSVEEAAALTGLAGVTVVDVRTPGEYDEVHIEGAVLVDFSAPTFRDEIAGLDPEGEYLVYCRSGNRSAQAVAIMAELGFDRVWDMQGGMIAYAQAGFPTAP